MTARPRLHYAWIVVAVVFVTMLVGAGTRSAPSILIVPLEKEFGWISAARQLGAASAAWIAGLIRVDLGDYFLAFTLAGSLCILASVMVLFIGRGPRPEAVPVAA